MKNYILDSAGYSLLLEGRGGAGMAEDLINLGRIRMPDGKVVDGMEFVDVVNSAMALFGSKYPCEYSFISDSPVIYLLDNSFCDTMCVDGRGVLYINIGFVYKNPPDGLGMHPKSVFNILYHECMHVFLSHISRTHAYNKGHNKNKLSWKDMNIATDLEVNGMMVIDKVCDSSFFETLEACYAKKVAGLPMEAIASNHKDVIDSFKRKANKPGKQGSGQAEPEQGDSPDKDDKSGNGDKPENGDKDEKPENGDEGGEGDKGENPGKDKKDGKDGDDGKGSEPEDKGYDHEFDDTKYSHGGDETGGGGGGGGGGESENDSRSDQDDVKSSSGVKGSGGDSSGRGGSGDYDENGGDPDGDSGRKREWNKASGARKMIGEIVRQSEVADKLFGSLERSGFDQSAIDRIKKLLESAGDKSGEDLSKLRDRIIKNKPDSALSRICTDIKISDAIVSAVWDEIVKKFLEHNTLMAGTRKKVPDKRIKWGDRRTLAHDMMRPYHPKGDGAPQNINVLIDTSGSVDSNLATLFAQTVAACCDKLRYTGVLLMPFAERVSEKDGVYIERNEVHDDPELVSTRVCEMCASNSAGRGTFITPCVNTILKYSAEEPKSVWIIFTDGEFGDYESLTRLLPSSKRILLVIYNSHIKKLMEKGQCLDWCVSPDLSKLSKCYVELDENIFKE